MVHEKLEDTYGETRSRKSTKERLEKIKKTNTDLQYTTQKT
jgi:hypothetical protein